MHCELGALHGVA